MLPFESMRELGIAPGDCEPDGIGTAAGQGRTLKMIRGHLDFLFGTTGLRVSNAQFSDVPFVLFGRRPFFEAHRVCFDERAEKFSVEPYE